MMNSAQQSWQISGSLDTSTTGSAKYNLWPSYSSNDQTKSVLPYGGRLQTTSYTLRTYFSSNGEKCRYLQMETLSFLYFHGQADTSRRNWVRRKPAKHTIPYSHARTVLKTKTLSLLVHASTLTLWVLIDAKDRQPICAPPPW